MADKKTLELQIKVATQEAVKAVSSLEEEIKGLATEAERFSSTGGPGLEDAFGDAEEAARGAAGGIDKIAGSIGKLAEVAVLLKALSAIRDLGTFALSTADSFQTARNELGMLLGDMEAGAGLFNQLQDFRSPFDIATLTQATNALVGANVPLNDLQANLTRFGDLAQGNAQRFASFTAAFSQAAMRGRADIRILNAYMSEGVPILDALARNFGVTSAEIVDMANKGKVSFEDLSRALDDLTASGGQFYGSMELASRRLASTQQELNEAVSALAASFGQMLLPSAVSVARTLTAITGAINDSPLLKGAFAGALITATGLLAAKAAMATRAFAAQMKLNLAKGVLNKGILAATIAVGALAAGFTALAASQERAAREAENQAFQQRQQQAAIEATRAAVVSLDQALANTSDADLDRGIAVMSRRVAAARQQIEELEAHYTRFREAGSQGVAADVASQIRGESESLQRMIGELDFALGLWGERRADWIDSMFGNTQAGRIERINEQLTVTQRFLSGANLSGGDRSRLAEIARNLTDELERATGDVNRTAARWRDAWEQTWSRFQAGQSIDPFAGIELDRGKRLADAWNNYIRTGNQTTIDQINAYYDARRTEVLNRLAEEEERTRRELNGSRIAALRYEEAAALETINRLEAQRVIAAGDSETEIQAIRERFAATRLDTEARYYASRGDVIRELELEEKRILASLSGSRTEALRYEMERSLDAIRGLEARRVLEAAGSEAEIHAIRERFAAARLETEIQFAIKIDTAQIDEARTAIKDWQQELSGSFTLALMSIEGFSAQASVIIGELSARLTELGASAALTGFEKFGHALGEGSNAAESLQAALAAMSQQILNQLPMMFLQAGLQLIANGQWALGLGFVAAAGSSAIISGFTGGAARRAQEEASANAHGGVYNEYGRAAQAFASGGAFTNQIVSSPTYFRFGGALGVMGEAGSLSTSLTTQAPP